MTSFSQLLNCPSTFCELIIPIPRLHQPTNNTNISKCLTNYNDKLRIINKRTFLKQDCASVIWKKQFALPVRYQLSDWFIYENLTHWRKRICGEKMTRRTALFQVPRSILVDNVVCVISIFFFFISIEVHLSNTTLLQMFGFCGIYSKMMKIWDFLLYYMTIDMIHDWPEVHWYTNTGPPITLHHLSDSVGYCLFMKACENSLFNSLIKWRKTNTA